MSQPPPVKISELPDGTEKHTPESLSVIVQDGVTMKGSIRPSPAKFFPAMTQAQLEGQFGTDLIIPDGESWSISIKNDMTLTKPFKIGNGSSLEIFAGSINLNLTYTGTGALFQNENPANPIVSLDIHNMDITGDGTNDIFDVVVSFVVVTNDVLFNNFDNTGTLDSGFLDLRFTALQGVNSGFILKNLVVGTFNQMNLNQGATSNDLTFITVLSSSVTRVVARDCFSADSGSSMFYLDPNSAVNSTFVIENTTGSFTDVFRQGVAQAITSVTDAAGAARFNLGGPAHNLSIGDFVIMNGFSTSSYNGAFIVEVVPTATEFMLEGVAFVADDTGTLNPASLDSTDVKVMATNNFGSQDSMFTGDSGLEIFGSEITVTINTANVPEVITSTSWAFSNLERFSIGVNNEGQLVTDDVSVRRYNIVYSGTIEKVGGGSVDIGIILSKNGTDVSFNAPHTVNTGKIQITGSDIIELTDTDTLQVEAINYLDTANIDVSQISLVVSLA